MPTLRSEACTEEGRVGDAVLLAGALYEDVVEVVEVKVSESSVRAKNEVIEG